MTTFEQYRKELEERLSGKDPGLFSHAPIDLRILLELVNFLKGQVVHWNTGWRINQEELIDAGIVSNPESLSKSRRPEDIDSEVDEIVAKHLEAK